MPTRGAVEQRHLQSNLAAAGPLVSGSFEAGVANPAGWTTSPTFDVFIDSGGAAPGQGLTGARVKADTQNVYATLTQTFDMAAASTPAGWVRWRGLAQAGCGLDAGWMLAGCWLDTGAFNDNGHSKFNTASLAVFSINRSGGITRLGCKSATGRPPPAATRCMPVRATSARGQRGHGATGVWIREIHVDGFAVTAVPVPASALLLARLLALGPAGLAAALRRTSPRG